MTQMDNEARHALDGPLTTQERLALDATAEALAMIRSLASGPIGDDNRKAIFELADAFINIPAHAAGPAEQRAANAFLLSSGIDQARRAHKQHRLQSQHLAPL